MGEEDDMKQRCFVVLPGRVILVFDIVHLKLCMENFSILNRYNQGKLLGTVFY